jgi:hypothetical protein
MKFTNIIALIGASNAVRLRQDPTTTDYSVINRTAWCSPSDPLYNKDNCNYIMTGFDVCNPSIPAVYSPTKCQLKT